MARKTLTVSEEAYHALARLKSKDESFTTVILRLSQRKKRKAPQWVEEQSGINPEDPIFRTKPVDWGKGTEKASKEVDKTLYG